MKPFDSEQYRKRTRAGYSGDECCLCGKPTAGIDGAVHVPVDHERGEFVTQAQADARGEAVSYYPIGPECAKKWSREYGNTESYRVRRSRGETIAFDRQDNRT